MKKYRVTAKILEIVVNLLGLLAWIYLFIIDLKLGLIGFFIIWSNNIINDSSNRDRDIKLNEVIKAVNYLLKEST